LNRRFIEHSREFGVAPFEEAVDDRQSLSLVRCAASYSRTNFALVTFVPS
jgi:hypothetical protein